MPMDLIGQRYGRWTVIDRSQRIGRYWYCKCDCGTLRDVFHGALRNGNSLSCGCYRVEQTGANALKHGHARAGNLTPTYHSWRNMHDECFLSSDARFYKIGALGISMDPAWKDFANFLADMGEKPLHATLTRHDEAKDFSKQNCFWRQVKARPGIERTADA